MEVKIDTKEIFHVISIKEEKLTAIMAEELEELVKNELETSNKSLILDLSDVKEIDKEIIDLVLKTPGAVGYVSSGPPPGVALIQKY